MHKFLILSLILFIGSPTSLAFSDNKDNKIESSEKSSKIIQKDLRQDNKKIEKDFELSKPSSKPNSMFNISNNDSKSQNSCTNSLQMIDKRIKVLQSNLVKRKSLTEKINFNLTAKLETLKASGLDTSEIEESLKNYLEQSEKLVNQREDLLTYLISLSNFNCETDSVNFKKNLKEFNSRFKNQNLEFNKLNSDFKSNVLQQIDNLISNIIPQNSNGVSNE